MNRVLVFSPHPDDEAIGCGGVLCRHVAQGDRVKVIFLTSGEKGGHGKPEDQTRRTREAEANAAARLMGFERPEFWREKDGALRATRALVDIAHTLIRTWLPHTVYVTHDLEMHPDHRAAARLVRGAVRDMNGTARPADLLMYEVWTPMPRMDAIVDITPFLKQKLEAIRIYRSQCKVVAFDAGAQGLNRYRGEMHCWPAGKFAEVFKRLAP